MRAKRLWALMRLGCLGLLVGTLVLALVITGSVPTADGIRDVGEDLGALGAVLYVPAVAVLTSLITFVPVFAGAAGLLFGTAAGTPLALAGVTAAACLQMTISRYLAREEVGSMLPKRVKRLDDFIDRRGFWAVLYVRLFPFVPFVPVNYGAGLTRLSVWAMAAGTAIGAAPRVWAWVVLGGSIDDLGSREARAAIAMLVVIGIVGFLLARRQVARERAARAQ
jgi:uncharacterized membrane protein YdjX (TVP38/TMEM64 family)